MNLSKAVLLLLALVPALAGAQVTGPSSSQSPYVLPSAPGWQTTSLISVGDGAKENGYVMAGIPDGLGAIAGKFEEGNYVADKAFMTVFMNHEIPNTLGVARAHGSTGAFVSQWTIHLNTLQVKWGQDLIQDVQLWDPVGGQFVPGGGTPAARFNRFCSADLPKASALLNPATGKGFAGRFFMDGEENSADGRAFAHVITGSEKGTSYELADLGRMAFENTLAHPGSGDKTVVFETDDTTPGQVYLYVGDKKTTGNPVERAGLTGGKLFVLKVTNGGANYANGPVARENNGAINGTFSLVDVSDSRASAAVLDTASIARGTSFARPEDANWDTQNPRVLYFVITGANIDGKAQNARLYKLTFDSITNPTSGTIEFIIERTPNAAATPPEPGFAQFDNITVAGDGSVMVQEDPGGNAYLARTYQVNPATKQATAVLQSDAARFAAPNPPPFNNDEESSGIIEVTDIVKSANWFEQGRRYFLADLQAHYPNGAELVEGGQLYLVASPRE
jgi:Bacterial protein of unknown function (DUF839)